MNISTKTMVGFSIRELSMFKFGRNKIMVLLKDYPTKLVP
jgi:hypothetical protein